MVVANNRLVLDAADPHDRVLVGVRAGVIRLASATRVELRCHPTHLEPAVGIELTVAVREPHGDRSPAPVEMLGRAVFARGVGRHEHARDPNALAMNRSGAAQVFGERRAHLVDEGMTSDGEIPATAHGTRSIASTRGLRSRPIRSTSTAEELAMATTGIGERLLIRALTAIWRRKDPPVLPTHHFSTNPSDNIQIPMNLVMPLADNSPLGRARLIQTLAGAVQEVIAGLDNTQIVHFARFTIVDDDLCMFSFYDGDFFANYVRDFIYNVGSAFDGLLWLHQGSSAASVKNHRDEFIQWVRDRDALQLEYPASVLQLGPEDDRDPVKLTRRLILLLDECRRTDPPRNIQLFAYRSYPGFTAAQIRDAFKIGW